MGVRYAEKKLREKLQGNDKKAAKAFRFCCRNSVWFCLELVAKSILKHTVLFKPDIFPEQYIHERIVATRSHDKNSNGQLTPGEFASLLSSLHLEFAQEDIDALAKKYDVNKNGNIDYIELQHGLLGNFEDHGSPKHIFRRLVTCIGLYFRWTVVAW